MNMISHNKLPALLKSFSQLRDPSLTFVIVLTLVGGCAEEHAQYLPTGTYISYATDLEVERWSIVVLDSDGIPMVLYHEEPHYNITTISQWALQNWSRSHLEHSPERLAKFRQAADWLVDHQESDGSWLATFRTSVGGFWVDPPWRSALWQGQALSVLTRAFHLTGDDRYLTAAQRAVRPFFLTIESGGVAADFAGHDYFEEYPTEPPLFTLNGHLFALIGLFDLAAAGYPPAAHLFEKGIETAVVALPFHQLESGSTYNLVHVALDVPPFQASEAYHRLHVELLDRLCSVTENSVLSSYRDRWVEFLAQQ